MKRILMRAGMSPLNNLDALQVLLKDTIRTNSGNMVFWHSLLRTLTLAGTEIDTIGDPVEYSNSYIEEINEKYDCFVIPFANAFRFSFQPELRRWTKMIKKLRIPCIVVGVGLQARIGYNFDDTSPLDNDVKNFVRAVLEKSDMVGVRGRVTGDYLKRLGFVEDKDFTIIGCPSLFFYGDCLPAVNKRELTPESMICFNSRANLPSNIHIFLDKVRRSFPNHYYIPQNTVDFKLLYAGVPLLSEEEVPAEYPQHANDHIFAEDRVRAFINVPTWLNFLSQATLSCGSRIHGNIAGILAGTPSYVLAHDSRILELVEYHNIPHMLAKDINEKTDLREIYEQADFDSVHKGHKKRFDTYTKFLKQNGLITIFDSGYTGQEEVPFDKKISKIELQPPIHSFISRSQEEKIERMEAFYTFFYEKNEELKQRIRAEERRKQEEKAKAKELNSLQKVMKKAARL